MTPIVNKIRDNLLRYFIGHVMKRRNSKILRVVLEFRNKFKKKVRKRKTKKEMDRQNIENDTKIAV